MPRKPSLISPSRRDDPHLTTRLPSAPPAPRAAKGRVPRSASGGDGRAHLQCAATRDEGVIADEADRAVEIRGLEDGVATHRALSNALGNRFGADGPGLAQ